MANIKPEKFHHWCNIWDSSNNHSFILLYFDQKSMKKQEYSINEVAQNLVS